MPIEQAPAQTSPGLDADAIVANIEATGSADGSPDGSPPAPTQPELIEYVTDGGKKVREPLEMVLKRASMGYHYAQRMADLKKNESTWQEKLQAAEKLSRWEEYDRFAQENPEWADHWNKAWEGRTGFSPQQPTQADPNNPLFGEVQTLKAQLAELGKFAKTVQDERTAAQRSAEDKALDSEIKSVREKYSKIDFDLADEDGKSLEFRVMEYATKNGIRSFKTAFHDFYHEHLVKAHEDGTKEQELQNRVEQRRAGVIGITDRPTKGIGKAQNLKSKSYEDLTREALTELGIS